MEKIKNFDKYTATVYKQEGVLSELRVYLNIELERDSFINNCSHLEDYDKVIEMWGDNYIIF